MDHLEAALESRKREVFRKLNSQNLVTSMWGAKQIFMGKELTGDIGGKQESS